MRAVTLGGAQTLMSGNIASHFGISNGEANEAAGDLATFLYARGYTLVQNETPETLELRVEMLEAHSENLIQRMYQAECDHESTTYMEDPHGNEYMVCEDCGKQDP
jgi:hypothetical protein